MQNIDKKKLIGLFSFIRSNIIINNIDKKIEIAIDVRYGV